MSDFQSEFRPEHGVWVLKRVECETSIDEDPRTVRQPVPAPGRTLRVVEAEPAVRS
ncbi:MAG: hypothetical protein ACRBN8_09360 [Nannocystales bacterium]